MKRARTALALASAALLSSAGCGDAPGGWRGTITDSAGIQVVQNGDLGLWAAGEAWTVERDLTIGTADGDPAYQFGQIAGIDVGADGRIYVMDQQAREVRVFDAEGRHVATMGQAGAGPGELSQAAGPVFVAPGDTVVVPDMMQQRITLYSAGGEPAGSHALPMADGIATKWLAAPNGDLVQQTMVLAFPGQEDVEQKNLLLRRHPTGELADTVLEMPIGLSVDFTSDVPSFTLFEAEPMWTLGPDGHLYTGLNSEYSVRVHSPEGELTRIVRKAFERRPITDSDEAEFRRVIEGLWRDGGMPPQALQMMSQRLSFADAYPAYANLLGGPDGTLWVQGIQTPDDIEELGGTFNIQDMGGTTWEVFDADGRFLGNIEMPPRFSPTAFIDGDLYGVLRDELDVQYAARFHLNRGAPVSDN